MKATTTDQPFDFSYFTSDPLRIIEVLWPDVELYDKQIQTIYAVRDCPEVFVPAANMMGHWPLFCTESGEGQDWKRLRDWVNRSGIVSLSQYIPQAKR